MPNTFAGFPRKKDITDIPIQELKNMEANELMEKYRLVIYSKNDIKEINDALNIIRRVIKKNSIKSDQE